MAKENFKVKKIAQEEIIVEEEKESKKGPFLLFWKKYGIIINTLLMVLTFTTFLVGMGLSLSTIFKESSKKTDIIPITLVEYDNLGGDNIMLSNAYPMSDNVANLLYDNNSDSFQPTRIKISNNNYGNRINYIVAVTETVDDESKRLFPEYIRFNTNIKNNRSNNFNLKNPNNVLTFELENGVKVPDNTYLLAEGKLNPRETIICEVRMWISDIVGNNMQNKSFKGNYVVYFEYTE